MLPALASSPALLVYLIDIGLITEPADAPPAAVAPVAEKAAATLRPTARPLPVADAPARAPLAAYSAPVTRIAQAAKASMEDPPAPLPRTSVNPAIVAFRGQLSEYISKLMRSDAAPILERIARVTDEREARSLVDRLFEMVSLYAGTTEAQKFADRFGNAL
jgi:hypothetical protein